MITRRSYGPKLSTLLMLPASLLIGATSAQSRVAYKEIAGPNNIVHGAPSSGNLVRIHGLDWWQNGLPNRDFKVIGVITDKRTNLVLSGHTLGSPTISRLVVKNGGDGVVFYDSQSKRFLVQGVYNGIYPGPNYLRADNGSVGFDRTTHLLVVRYEKD